MNSPYPEAFHDLHERFEEALVKFADQHYDRKDSLGKICHYALTGPGKRARGLFCLLAQKAHGIPEKDLLMSPAIALEMVHCYSLVHDDLPCMDNDELRRGRPTAHVRFDEAGALLAGDTLLTDAFGLLSGSIPWEGESIGDGQRLNMMRELSLASGTGGMVSGQMLDLYWTGRAGASKEDLDSIHLRKTGCLIGASCSLGAAAAGGATSSLERYRSFGQNVGLAFQVIDDLLDEKQGTGKSAGKDRDAGKLTYLATNSLEQCRQAARSYTHDAIAKIKPELPLSKPIMDFSADLLNRAY